MRNASKIKSVIHHFISSANKSIKERSSVAIKSLLCNLTPKLFTLSNSSGKNIKRTSHEQSSRRLLSNKIIDDVAYARNVLQSFAITSEIELVIDRTNWKHGAKAINFLVLAFIFENTAIPLYWLMLDNNGGNSNSDQRMELVQWFTKNFPDISIKNLYADREFPSNQFLKDLLMGGVNFIFRTKSSVKATDGNKKISLDKIHKQLHNQPNRTRIENKIRRIYDCRVFLHVRLNDANEKVFLISNSNDINSFQLYRRRWTIENMFGKFKSKGFNLEASHMVDLSRLSNLFLLMSIAFCVAVKLGHIAQQINPIKIKHIKQNNKIRQTFEFSLFNFGAKLLKNFFDNYLSKKVVIKQLSKILNYPPNAIISKRLAIYKIIANF